MVPLEQLRNFYEWLGPKIQFESNLASRFVGVCVLHRIVGTFLPDLPPLFNPANYFEQIENAFEAILSVNMLCLPEEDSPSSPLRQINTVSDWFQ